ncbi:MAG TPA: deoxyribose-phosphate aldolase [Bacteroides sp.]|nr:deoxyribose-phosphate aldolase [Bacteroides sp.]
MSHIASLSFEKLKPILDRIGSEEKLGKSLDNLKLMFSLIDLTSLNTDDTADKIKKMCLKVNGIKDQFPGVPNVGAVCVYPSMVHAVKTNLLAEGVGIASVAAGFPSSQTFLQVKEMESKLAVDSGATEIDIVISVGRFLDADYEFMSEEIRKIREIISPAKLKVILETGLLSSPGQIYKASVTCLQAGADFIKTSTGKIQPAATPEAVLVMCHALKDFFDETGRKAGIKPAGGISTADEALMYAGIIKSTLGTDWLDPKLFRIGASRLANQILSEISHLKSGIAEDVSYF